MEYKLTPWFETLGSQNVMISSHINTQQQPYMKSSLLVKRHLCNVMFRSSLDCHNYPVKILTYTHTPLSFFSFLAVLGVESKASGVLGKHSTTGLC